MTLDNANIFSFSALPTERVPFDETTLNVLIRDLPKSYPFDIILFDGTFHTINKELDLYDFLLLDYYDTFNKELESYRQKLANEARLAEELRLQKIADAELLAKHEAAAALAMKEIEDQRLAFLEKYGDVDEETRIEMDKQFYVEKAIQQNEIKKHNDRVKRQLNNKFNVSLAQYDLKYLDCEIALFDKLRADAVLYTTTNTVSLFLSTYYYANYASSGLSCEELIEKILNKADARDKYIASLISSMKEDLKIHIKE